jgi:hypothetical protein
MHRRHRRQKLRRNEESERPQTESEERERERERRKGRIQQKIYNSVPSFIPSFHLRERVFHQTAGLSNFLFCLSSEAQLLLALRIYMEKEKSWGQAFNVSHSYFERISYENIRPVLTNFLSPHWQLADKDESKAKRIEGKSCR